MGFKGGGGGGFSGLTSLSSFITSNVNVNNSATANVTSLSLISGTWIIFYQVLQLNGGNTSFCQAWVGTTSNSYTGAIGGVEEVLSNNYSGTLSGSIIVKPTATTTYYLNAFNSNGSPNNVTWHIESTGTANSTGAQTSGMIAIKIA